MTQQLIQKCAFLFETNYFLGERKTFLRCSKSTSLLCYTDMIVILKLQFQKSNQNEVILKIIDFDASGMYCCEVSLESPIFTKASNEEQVHVFRKYPLIINWSLILGIRKLQRQRF